MQKIYKQFGNEFKSYKRLEDLSGDEIVKDLPAAGKIRLSVFSAKIIKGKLVRIGWL